MSRILLIRTISVLQKWLQEEMGINRPDFGIIVQTAYFGLKRHNDLLQNQGHLPAIAGTPGETPVRLLKIRLKHRDEYPTSRPRFLSIQTQKFLLDAAG